MRHPIFPVDVETVLTERMRRAQDGDRAAYAQVLRHCRDAFERLARERCPAGCSEVEIVRRCLLALHAARHTFDPKRSFCAWIGAIARRHGIGAKPVGGRGTWHARIGALLREGIGIGSRKEAGGL